MKNIFNIMMLVTALCSVHITQAVEMTSIRGAGGSFPALLYTKWAEAYRSKTGVSLNYQAVGSDEGLNQIVDKTVDFGASDIPLKPAELQKAGLMQFPTTIGGVVPVINVEGIPAGALKLDGETLGDIFIGKITRWNDPAIAALNKGLNLPNQEIGVIHQAYGSGTSFIFGHYLSQVSPLWRVMGSKGTAAEWKVGQHIAHGNKAAAEWLLHSKGSIGYVEYGYAVQSKLNQVQVKNHDGHFVKAHIGGFRAAAAAAEWDKAPGFYKVLTNEVGKEAWPITAATFVLIHKNQDQPLAGKEVLKFFHWAYQSGESLTTQLDYVSLPSHLITLIQSAWKDQIKDNQGNALW